MDVNGHPVAVGDWLRCTADDWEGQVIAVDATNVTLGMDLGQRRVCTADEVEWNSWDPRAVAP